MPDRASADEELIAVTRTYLTRRRGQTAPRNLETDAVNYAVTKGRTKRAAALLGTAALVMTGVLTAGIVLAFHRQAQPAPAPGPSTQEQVQIVRFPGGLALPPLDRTIRDASIVTALADDIENLPIYPSDERCPLDFGTYYALTFTLPGAPPWTAKVGAEGCQVVEVAGQRTRWAAHSLQLWSELTKALGIKPLQPPTA
jgi:hypothetical protein